MEQVVIENKVKIVDELTGRIMDEEGILMVCTAIEIKENVKIELTQTFKSLPTELFPNVQQ